jgi:DNA-binding transcriptional regulator YiaG
LTKCETIKDFGALIKSLRNKAGMTQLEFATVIDTHKSNISRWEMGKYRPDKLQLIKIINYVGPKSELARLIMEAACYEE